MKTKHVLVLFQLLTNVGKLTAGRLRPHFHDVCNSNSSSLAEVSSDSDSDS